MLDPGRVPCLLAEVRARLRNAAEGGVHLVDGARHDEPQEACDQTEQDDVVQRDPRRARDATAGEDLEGGAHRGRQDESEEEERNEEPELPQGEREHDDSADDEGDQGGPLCCLRHRQPIIPEESIRTPGRTHVRSLE